MKKIIAVLISLSIWLSLAAPFSALAQESLYGSETVNVSASDTRAYGGKTYYSKGLELYNIVKEKLDEINQLVSIIWN